MKSVCIIFLSLASVASIASPLDPFVRAVKTGAEPVKYVLARMDQHPLIIVDDVLHNLKDPWDFYTRLVQDPGFQKRTPTIFLEALCTNAQPSIDAFLNSPQESLSLLAPAFQISYDEYGWRYQTYVDFLRAVRNVNQRLPEEKRLKVVAVSPPVWWNGFSKMDDVSTFRDSLGSRDYAMYQTIRDGLDNFGPGKRGIFLTNTRHAYTGVHKKDGTLFWNTGTFFRKWHPGKSWSLRFHSVTLIIEAEKKVQQGSLGSAAGTDRMVYRLDRIAKGLWDSAFLANGNKPAAFDIRGNAFGKTPYVGNHQLASRAGETMADAYDGVLFFSPLEKQSFAASTNIYVDDAFMAESARRYRVSRSEKEIQDDLASEKVGSVEELVRQVLKPRPERSLVNSLQLCKIDSWRTPAKQ